MDKISCGGFYIGEGLTMEQVDGKPTLKAEGGGGEGGAIVVVATPNGQDGSGNTQLDMSITIDEFLEAYNNNGACMCKFVPPGGTEYVFYVSLVNVSGGMINMTFATSSSINGTIGWNRTPIGDTARLVTNS